MKSHIAVRSIYKSSSYGHNTDLDITKKLQDISPSSVISITQNKETYTIFYREGGDEHSYDAYDNLDHRWPYLGPEPSPSSITHGKVGMSS